MWYMNEERELLQQAFREFAQTRVRPHVDKMEEEEADAKELLLEMGQLGFLGMGVDEEHCGAGNDYISVGLLMEELAKESYTVAFLALIERLFVKELIKNGNCSQEQLEKFVYPTLRGEKILALSECEPAGVLDYEAVATTAKKVDGGWVINGGKVFTTLSDVADNYIVMCRTGETVNPETMEGISEFLVPGDAEGVQSGHIENKCGWKGSRTGSMYYNDVFVPDSSQLMCKADLFVDAYEFGGQYAAICLGACEAILDKTISYNKERKQFGGTMWDNFQVMRNDLAKLSGKVAVFREAVYGHFNECNNGGEPHLEAFALKIAGAELLEEVARECVILMGGIGVVRETGIERYYRDNLTSMLGCITNKTALTFMSYFI